MTPDGWLNRRLGDFCQRVRRLNHQGEDLPPLSITKDRGVVLQSEKYKKRIATDPKRYLVAEDGDFAFDPMSLYYGSIGKVAGLGRGLVSPDYVTFAIDSSVDGDFLNHLLRFPEMHERYEALAETGNVFGKRRRLYWSVFEEIRLSLPPLGEQRKIAAILDSIDDAIARMEAEIHQVRVVKEALLAELVLRGIPGRHVHFTQRGFGELPAQWDIARCGDLFDVQLGKMLSAASRSKGTQFPYLRNENVQWHRLNLSSVSTMHFTDTERVKFRLRAGDLLVCEGGHVGRCAIWKGEMTECYYQKALHRIRARSERITTAFMQYYMMVRFRLQGQLVTEAGSGTTIPHLPLEKLVELPVPVPPREEQDEIVGTLASFDGHEQAILDLLDARIAFKAALAASLLTGDLRVVNSGPGP